MNVPASRARDLKSLTLQGWKIWRKCSSNVPSSRVAWLETGILAWWKTWNHWHVSIGQSNARAPATSSKAALTVSYRFLPHSLIAAASTVIYPSGTLQVLWTWATWYAASNLRLFYVNTRVSVSVFFVQFRQTPYTGNDLSRWKVANVKT